LGRRADHTPEELRALVLASARKIVESEGSRALTTRRVAQDIGYTSGTLYNVFRDRDDLVLAVNGETLERLAAACAVTSAGRDADKGLRTLARAYIAFSHDNQRIWSLVFENPPPADPPGWYKERVARVFAIVEQALAPFFAPGRERAREHSARVLWASLHGIALLKAQGQLWESASGLADALVTYYVAGLRALRDLKAPARRRKAARGR
jgi:AcrR family transcriptional regulator